MHSVHNGWYSAYLRDTVHIVANTVIPRGLAYAPLLPHVTSFLAAEFTVTAHSASPDLAPGTTCQCNCMPSLILNCSSLTISSWLLKNYCNALANKQTILLLFIIIYLNQTTYGSINTQNKHMQTIKHTHTHTIVKSQITLTLSGW